MKKKLLMLLLGGCLVISLAGCGNKENTNTKKEKEAINNYVAYIKINPLVKLELTQTCKDNDCTDPVITNYDLVNDDAKEMYKDIDFKDKTLLDIIPTLTDTVYDNGINFNNISIQTDWEDVYSSEEIEKAITDNSSYNNKYTVIIDIKEDISESEIVIEDIKNKEFELQGVTSSNWDADKFFDTNTTAVSYSVMVNHGEGIENFLMPYTVKIFGSEEDINGIDTDKLRLAVDISDYSTLSCDIHNKRLILSNINDKNIYYTIEPSIYKVDVWHIYWANIKHINKNEAKILFNENDCAHYKVYYLYDDYVVAECYSSGSCIWDMSNDTSKEIINYSTNWFGASFSGNSFSFHY
ncbi:MAG: hypothetical protein NC181_02885 [Clostridium sp.]|nr:hypothetical protein [Clostridium sp.]MCM1444182.1 hypothetical protein [Candidatus Amulumruptor caecigallinarius]